MNKIHHNVSQRLWRRVLFAAIVVSVITGVGLYFYERENLEDRAVNISKSLIHQAFQNGDVQARLANPNRLKSLLDKLVQGQFKYIELYDKHGTTLAESDSKDASIATILRAYHEMETGAKRSANDYLTYHIDGDMYVQVFISLPYGRAEVVYEVPEEIYRSMQQALAVSVVIAILSVLFMALILYPLVKNLVNNIQKNEAEILQSNVDMLSLIGGAIAKRDSDTDEHNFRVTLYALKLAEALAIPEQTCRELIKGAFVHDIGKIAIPDAVLLKPGKLNDEEFAIMKQHVAEGADIVREVNWLQKAQDVVLYHHEKYDGSGYLNGLKGEAIPLIARLFAIVDVFDALTSKRPYKEPFTLEKSISILQESSGSHFDPELVAAFTPLAHPLLTSYGTMSRQDLKAALLAEINRYFKA